MYFNKLTEEINFFSVNIYKILHYCSFSKIYDCNTYHLVKNVILDQYQLYQAPIIFAKCIRRNRGGLALHSCAAISNALESSGRVITRTKQ